MPRAWKREWALSDKTINPSIARCVSVLGTGSDVGKSIVVTALCRIFRNRGINVAPFKAQNMSNNSYVTPDGGEMGRAQVVQAEAARAPLHTDMNPVLLKPCTDTGAQVIVNGQALKTCQAREYFADTSWLFQASCQALARLREQYELVVLEGAGSCAEVNLRERDFVNLRMAQACQAPVILVADIDRGGVFAQIVGTLAVLPPEDRASIAGLIINRFRGDATLFNDGIAYLEKQTGLPVLGLIPYFYHIEIDSEDGMPLESQLDPAQGPQFGKINVAVLRVPHISNFTDFNPLIREPAVCLHYLTRVRDLKDYDLLLLPGSKNVRADLQWLRDLGWEACIRGYGKTGGRVGGICGGYQMLGRTIVDPDGVEGPPGETRGLNLLPLVTTLMPSKILKQTEGIWQANAETVKGYEIHMGVTESVSPLKALIQRNCDGSMEGACSDSGHIWGTYLHGLFDATAFRQAFLSNLAPDRFLAADSVDDVQLFKDKQYDLLAEHFEAYLDMEKLEEIMRWGNGKDGP
ncbi:MAG: cobyric acid synthase [Phycisphaeraceae bacterium]|nr:cobyric acid synthase [Phycisphaeraceae bacterium]